MANEKNWFIAYIRPRSEKRVTEILTRRKVVHYYPNLLNHNGLRKSKDDIHRQFNCIVFLHLTDAELQSVQHVDGITGFMFWLNKPAIMKEEEIEAIKQFIHNNEKISIEKTDVTGNLDSIRFRNSVTEKNEVESHRLHLTSLGFSLLAYQQQEPAGILRSVA